MFDTNWDGCSLKYYFCKDVLRVCRVRWLNRAAIVSSALIATVTDRVTFTFTATEALTDKSTCAKSFALIQRMNMNVLRFLVTWSSVLTASGGDVNVPLFSRDRSAGWSTSITMILASSADQRANHCKLTWNDDHQVLILHTYPMLCFFSFISLISTSIISALTIWLWTDELLICMETWAEAQPTASKACTRLISVRHKHI